MSDDHRAELRRCERRLARERARVAELEAIIEEKTRRLYEVNQHLETKVARRTRELGEALAAAEAASEARKQFLSVMSHELRTPLTAVIGTADLLRRSDLCASQRDQVDTIGTSGRHLLGLIGKILDFSKIDSGKLELDEAPVELRALVEGTVGTFEATATATGVGLKVEVDPCCPRTVVADGLRLRQILTNLVGNALRFTPRGHVSVIVRANSRAPGRVELSWSVEDTGCGIPAEKFDSIFDPFAQAEAGTTRKYGGTGLGLAISSELVALMGGEIEVSSQLGEGSRFSFTTHHDVATASRRTRSPGPVAFRPGQRVLVVDDHPVNIKVACSMLDLLGVEATAAGDGPEALEVFARAENENCAFDLVLLDCHMPRMSGDEVATILRDSGHAIPIVAATADTGNDNRARILAAGMNGILSKPYGLDDLRATLERHLELSTVDVEREGGPPSAKEPAARANTTMELSSRAFDENDLIARMGPHSGLCTMVVETFLDAFGTQLDEIEAAVGGELTQISSVTHRAKGAAASVSAVALAELLSGFERHPECLDEAALAAIRSRAHAAMASMRDWLSARAA